MYTSYTCVYIYREREIDTYIHVYTCIIYTSCTRTSQRQRTNDATTNDNGHNDNNNSDNSNSDNNTSKCYNCIITDYGNNII